MLNSKSIPPLICIWLLTQNLSCRADENYLPPGNYLYLGREGSIRRPQKFSVNEAGKLDWNDASKPNSETVAPDPKTVNKAPVFEVAPVTTPPATSENASSPSPKWAKTFPNDIERNEYPVLYWRAKPIQGTRLTATLVTRYKHKQESFNSFTGSSGVMQYQLAVFGDPKAFKSCRGVTINLSDSKGFDLLYFDVHLSKLPADTSSGVMFKGETKIESPDNYKDAARWTPIELPLGSGFRNF